MEKAKKTYEKQFFSKIEFNTVYNSFIIFFLFIFLKKEIFL